MIRHDGGGWIAGRRLGLDTVADRPLISEKAQGCTRQEEEGHESLERTKRDTGKYQLLPRHEAQYQHDTKCHLEASALRSSF